MKIHVLVLKKILSHPQSLLLFVLLTITYLTLTSLVLNYKLFTSFYHTSVTVSEKIEVTPAIVLQTFYIQTPTMLLLHLLTALLFALNIVLITQKVANIKSPSLKFGIGAGIISVATAGCASCGLSLLALLGLGGALTLLPYEGIEILLLTIVILTLTFIYNLNTITKVCKIEKVNRKKLPASHRT